jgi:hypothetical protein
MNRLEKERASACIQETVMQVWKKIHLFISYSKRVVGEKSLISTITSVVPVAQG